MVEEEKKAKKPVKDIAIRILKATIKAVIVIVLYSFVMPLLAPLFQLIPSFTESIQAFVTIYIVLMIIGDLTARTIFEHVFNVVRALFIMFYLILTLGDGVINVNMQNVNLMVNLSMFFTIAVTLSLLTLGKAMLQAIGFIAERAERGSGIPASA
jgi:hypothetical protein